MSQTHNFYIITCLLFPSDSTVVQAEPVQYGLLDTPTSLNCSTTLDIFDFAIIIQWHRGQGQNETRLRGRPQFDNTDISHEGLYRCEVDISSMGIRISKTINFSVIGKPAIEVINTPPPQIDPLYLIVNH